MNTILHENNQVLKSQISLVVKKKANDFCYTILHKSNQVIVNVYRIKLAQGPQNYEMALLVKLKFLT